MAVSAVRSETTHAGSLEAIGSAQGHWARTPVKARLRVIKKLRHLLSEHADHLARTVRHPVDEVLLSEILPLAEACEFLERRATRLLAPVREGRSGRPVWLWGVDLEIRREPLGIVMVIGPANYPLFLPAVQAVQALAAGNAVVIKPGVGGSDALAMFANLVQQAGLPDGLITVLDERPEAAQPWLRSVDKVFLTGSSQTGTTVLQTLAAAGTPSVMELSGLDALIVLGDADLELAARAIDFGLRWNSGDTCIAPRRVFVHTSRHADLRAKLPLHIPVAMFASDEEAVTMANNSDYALGASVFGSEGHARAVAQQLRCGVVVINDMIVPTADPRLPFGGRKRSGFGVTRGAEGLLETTAIKAIAARRGSFRPHLSGADAMEPGMFTAFIQSLHAPTWSSRAQAAIKLMRIAARSKRKDQHNEQAA